MDGRTRSEHLAWCKSRAIGILNSGDPAGAVASMLSDLKKWEGGLMYNPETLTLLAADGLLFAGKSVSGTRRWIEGFN